MPCTSKQAQKHNSQSHIHDSGENKCTVCVQTSREMLITKNQAGKLQISLDGLYPTLVKSVNNRQNKQVKIA